MPTKGAQNVLKQALMFETNPNHFISWVMGIFVCASNPIIQLVHYFKLGKGSGTPFHLHPFSSGTKANKMVSYSDIIHILFIL